MRLDEMTLQDTQGLEDGGLTFAAWHNYHTWKAKALGWDKPRFPKSDDSKHEAGK